MADTYEVGKLRELVNDYFNGKRLASENAGVEIRKNIIDGEDLITALSDVVGQYKNIKDDLENKNIKDDLENLVKGKTGIFVNEIRTIIKKNYPQ